MKYTAGLIVAALVVWMAVKAGQMFDQVQADLTHATEARWK